MFWKHTATSGEAPSTTSLISTDAAKVAAVGLTDRDLYQEHLARLEDEEGLRASHAHLVWAYNRSSISFWVLTLITMAFAILNGWHGWYSTSAMDSVVTAAAIAAIFFSVELTIPVSSQLTSWEGLGATKIAVRLTGAFGFVAAVIFSLMVLQGKFAGNADTVSARTETVAATLTGDQQEFLTVQKKVAELSPLVKRSVNAIDGEIEVVLSSQVGRGKGAKTLKEVTEACRGKRTTSQEREQCASVDALRRERNAAVSLEEAQQRYDKFRGNLTTAVNRGDTARTHDAADRAIAKATGINLDNIRLFKASFMVALAAFVSHVLWLGHGFTVNGAIARHRQQTLAKAALQRAVTRSVTAEDRAKAQLEAEFSNMATNKLGLYGGMAKVMAPPNARVNELPATEQVKAYMLNRCVLGPELFTSLGKLHDDYVAWSVSNKATKFAIDRFMLIVKECGFELAADGRVLGVALKHG